MTQMPDCSEHSLTTAQRLLPTELWQLPLARLSLESGLAEQLAGRGLLTVGCALELPTEALREGGAITPDEQVALCEALHRALADGLRQFDTGTANDWPTLRAQLLGPLDDIGRRILIAAVGI